MILCLPIQAQQSSDSSAYFYNKVIKPRNAQDLIDGYLYYKNEKERYLKEKEIENQLYALNMMSISQIGLGSYYDAEKSTIEALQIVDENPTLNETYRFEIITRLYNNLGLINKDLNKNEEAIKNYQKALTVAQKQKDSFYIYNNIGLLYHAQDNFIIARNYFNTAQKLARGAQDSINIAIAMDSWGLNEVKLENLDGLAAMKSALQLRKRLKDESRIYTSYRHLTAFYKEQENLKMATLYADSAIQQANTYSVEYKEDALFNKLSLSADSDITSYLRINDSISRSKLINENKFSGAKYNLKVEKKQKELALKESADQKAKNKAYQFTGILIILLALFLITLIIIWNKKKRDEQIYLTESRISKKVHDEVSNDVYRMMTQIQNNNGIYPEVLNNLEHIYKKTRDISRENSLVEVDRDFSLTLKDLLLSYQSETLNIITRNSEGVSWKSISKSKKITIYRALQELVTNTTKHGKGSIILIEFSKSKRGLKILYKDNGVGGELSNKNGLQNVENRIIAHKGTITFESEKNKGFKAHIQI